MKRPDSARNSGHRPKRHQSSCLNIFEICVYRGPNALGKDVLSAVEPSRSLGSGKSGAPYELALYW